MPQYTVHWLAGCASAVEGSSDKDQSRFDPDKCENAVSKSAVAQAMAIVNAVNICDDLYEAFLFNYNNFQEKCNELYPLAFPVSPDPAISKMSTVLSNVRSLASSSVIVAPRSVISLNVGQIASSSGNPLGCNAFKEPFPALFNSFGTHKDVSAVCWYSCGRLRGWENRAPIHPSHGQSGH